MTTDVSQDDNGGTKKGKWSLNMIRGRFTLRIYLGNKQEKSSKNTNHKNNSIAEVKELSTKYLRQQTRKGSTFWFFIDEVAKALWDHF